MRVNLHRGLVVRTATSSVSMAASACAGRRVRGLGWSLLLVRLHHGRRRVRHTVWRIACCVLRQAPIRQAPHPFRPHTPTTYPAPCHIICTGTKWARPHPHLHRDWSVRVDPVLRVCSRRFVHVMPHRPCHTMHKAPAHADTALAHALPSAHAVGTLYAARLYIARSMQSFVTRSTTLLHVACCVRYCCPVSSVLQCVRKRIRSTQSLRAS